MKGYIDNYNFAELECMKYWAPPASMPAATKRQHLENMIAGGNYFNVGNYPGLRDYLLL